MKAREIVDKTASVKLSRKGVPCPKGMRRYFAGIDENKIPIKDKNLIRDIDKGARYFWRKREFKQSSIISVEKQTRIIDRIHTSGLSMAEVCREFDVQRDTFRNAIKKRGLRYNAKERKIEQNIE